MTDLENTLHILLDVYAYNHAFRVAKSISQFPSDALFLIELLKERRELNLDFLSQHAKEVADIESQYGISLQVNDSIEEEQLANYIYDLEIKVKNGEIIDFVRSVSPILYRLFLRLIRKQIPNFDHYVRDAKNDQYDTWEFDRMKEAQHPIFESFLGQRQSRNVTTRSLADLLQLSQLPENVKETVRQLRQFEKSVRNPLAHLIKAFDEEELHRTTQFSSLEFLNKIIELATYSGVMYQREPFYFDQINTVIESQFSPKK
ncbi:LytR family transcriptional regulator [Streptococcus uberis]|uniref:LytR family transcriptional regulator n=1 Tax=Streptococcus uberis TaxID=1349 RepID=UPI001FF316D8|nr:LytR family transcriptional regulator [Streptococcus uberis]MCK1219811.1 LytR family transcriptional regulator [Streptococcus uberis]